MRSRPSSHTEPPSMRPGGLMRRSRDSAIVDLPEPDSPATPRRSPARKLKVMPSAARTAPPEV